MSGETSDNVTETSLEATSVEQGRKVGQMKRKKRLHKAIENWRKQKEHRKQKLEVKQLRDVSMW